MGYIRCNDAMVTYKPSISITHMTAWLTIEEVYRWCSKKANIPFTVFDVYYEEPITGISIATMTKGHVT